MKAHPLRRQVFEWPKSNYCSDKKDSNMKYSQRWRQTTIANRTLVVSSCFMAVATGCLAVAAGFQYYTLREQLRAMHGQQTTMQEQANAASRSADIAASQSQAVNDSAKAAKDSAAAASMLTEQNKEIIAAARTQAGASKTTANSAEQSLQTARRSMIVGSRAYVGINSIQTDLKRGQITVWLENIGKIPATNIKASGATALPQTNASGEPEAFKVLIDDILDLGINELFPGTFRLPVVIWIKDFAPETERLVLSRQKVLHVSCVIRYDNGFGSRSESWFTFYYLPPPDDKWIPRSLIRDSKKQQSAN
jgi:hypothetical protein